MSSIHSRTVFVEPMERAWDRSTIPNSQKCQKILVLEIRRQNISAKQGLQLDKRDQVDLGDLFFLGIDDI